MNYNQLLLLSLICFIIAAVFYVISYFFFHYLTNSGFVKEKRMQAGKPFVTNMVGVFATIMFACSVLSLIIALITK